VSRGAAEGAWPPRSTAAWGAGTLTRPCSPHFADQFKEEYKIDVRTNARACQRLRVACEKLKKVLSADPEAPIQVGEPELITKERWSESELVTKREHIQVT